MSVATDHNLARLAEASFERSGDYPSLLFEGRWHRSGELFERAQPDRGAGSPSSGWRRATASSCRWRTARRSGSSTTRIWRAGAVVTPATFLLPADELRHVIADAEASRRHHDARVRRQGARGGRRARQRALRDLAPARPTDGVVALRVAGGTPSPAPIVRAGRRGPRRAAVHRRHHRPRRRA